MSINPCALFCNRGITLPGYTGISLGLALCMLLGEGHWSYLTRLLPDSPSPTRRSWSHRLSPLRSLLRSDSYFHDWGRFGETLSFSTSGHGYYSICNYSIHLFAWFLLTFPSCYQLGPFVTILGIALFLVLLGIALVPELSHRTIVDSAACIFWNFYLAFQFFFTHRTCGDGRLLSVKWTDQTLRRTFLGRPGDGSEILAVPFLVGLVLLFPTTSPHCS